MPNNVRLTWLTGHDIRTYAVAGPPTSVRFKIKNKWYLGMLERLALQNELCLMYTIKYAPYSPSLKCLIGEIVETNQPFPFDEPQQVQTRFVEPFILKHGKGIAIISRRETDIQEAQKLLGT